MIGRVHSIESFGTVDGPGIRMVIFLSGCPMRCLYCHNPDTWDPKGGTPMTVEQLLNQYDNARHFYRKGGITVSGGEPLTQIGFVTELFETAKKRGIHTCLDTSGVTFRPDSAGVREKFDRLAAVTRPGAFGYQAHRSPGALKAVRTASGQHPGVCPLSGTEADSGLGPPCGGTGNYGPRRLPPPPRAVSGDAQKHQSPGCPALPRHGENQVSIPGNPLSAGGYQSPSARRSGQSPADHSQGHEGEPELLIILNIAPCIFLLNIYRI